MSAAQVGGASSECVAKWTEAIDSRVERMVQFVVREQTDAVLIQCGLKDIMVLIEAELVGGGNTEEFSKVVGLEPKTVKEKIDVFYSSLFSPPIPGYEDISDGKIRGAARRGTADAIIDCYQQIFGVVMDPKHGYAEHGVSCKHSPSQVKILLNV